MRALIRFAGDEAGATAIEYAMIAALVGCAIVAVLATLGTNLSAKYGTVATGFK